MLNHIVIIGRLTRDPEIKSTSNGTAVGTFTVAADRDFKGQNGEKETDFIPVVVWRGLAETCGRYLAKGKMVAVNGRLQIRTYEANDGSKRRTAEIVAENVYFLSPVGNNSESNNSTAYDDMSDFGEDGEPIDELPF